MKFDNKTIKLINKHRRDIQRETKTIDDGESVGIGIWYSFIIDHAQEMNLDPKQLARDQLEAILEASIINVVRPH